MKCDECGKAIGGEPRYVTPPVEGSLTWADEIYAEGELMGTPLMPWQGIPAYMIGEQLDNGLPRYQTIIISVPRQSGKTTVASAAISAKAKRADRQRLYGSAQTRMDAAKRLAEIGLALGNSAGTLGGVGRERITWPNGSTYEVIAPSPTGGQGVSASWLFLDEAWTVQETFLGGIRPTMAAKKDAQMALVSTMGTEESEVWNRLVLQGQDSLKGEYPDTAYLEYSAETDDDCFREELWHDWMPALGITTSHRFIKADMGLLSPGSFVRAYGNRTTAVLDSIFLREWIEDAWAIFTPVKEFVVAVDVNEDPKGYAITAAYPVEDKIGVRTIEFQPGSHTTLPQTVKEVLDKNYVQAVVFADGDPVEAVRADLKQICEDAYVPLVVRAGRQVAADTSNFYQAMRERTVVLERQEWLEEALGKAVRKDFKDMWFIHRRQMKVDASPLISTILAYGTAREMALSPTGGVGVW